MLLKELQLGLQAQHLTFREEIQKVIDKNNENFQIDVRRSVNVNVDKIKVLRTRIKKIELYLNKPSDTSTKSIPVNSFTMDADTEG